jgi:hypothetical protein
MDKHWIDSLPGDLPQRMRSKYYKHRGIVAGLPFRDHVCRPPNDPIDIAALPCPDLRTYIHPVSSLVKINIGASPDDLNGDTILEGLKKVQDNFNLSFSILSGIDTFIRSRIDIDAMLLESSWINIDKVDLPIDTQIGDWLSKTATGYVLSEATDPLTHSKIEGPLNPLGVISEIDPNSPYARLTTAGVLSGVYYDLQPSETYYISTTAGKLTTVEYINEYSKPVMTGISTDMGLIDIKVGTFDIVDNIRATEIYPDCIPFIPPIEPEYVKLDEVSGEGVVQSTVSPQLEVFKKTRSIQEITGEAVIKHIPRDMTYNSQRFLEEITGEASVSTPYISPSNLIPVWLHLEEVSGEGSAVRLTDLEYLISRDITINEIACEAGILTEQDVQFTLPAETP